MLNMERKRENCLRGCEVLQSNIQKCETRDRWQMGLRVRSKVCECIHVTFIAEQTELYHRYVCTAETEHIEFVLGGGRKLRYPLGVWIMTSMRKE